MTLIMAEKQRTRRFEDIDREEFDQAFLTALLLTGGVEQAEISMLEGMGAMDSEAGGRSLLNATLEVAVRQARSTRTDSYEGRRSAALSLDRILLPLDLRRVLLLPRDRRHCFVLRVLVGLSVHQCSQVLRLSEGEVAANAVSAAVFLASLREEYRSTGQATTSSMRILVPN